MKTPEDEAFDELATRQGDWGSGFQVKPQKAADKLQEPWNEDEWRRNNWRCGHGWLRGEQCEICNAAQPMQEPVAHLWECLGKWSAYLVTNGKQADCAPPSWLVEAIQNATAPSKREWAGLTEEDRKAALLTAYKEWECEELLLCAREDYLLIEQALKEKNT